MNVDGWIDDIVKRADVIVTERKLRELNSMDCLRRAIKIGREDLAEDKLGEMARELEEYVKKFEGINSIISQNY